MANESPKRKDDISDLIKGSKEIIIVSKHYDRAVEYAKRKKIEDWYFLAYWHQLTTFKNPVLIIHEKTAKYRDDYQQILDYINKHGFKRRIFTNI